MEIYIKVENAEEEERNQGQIFSFQGAGWVGLLKVLSLSLSCLAFTLGFLFELRHLCLIWREVVIWLLSFP